MSTWNTGLQVLVVAGACVLNNESFAQVPPDPEFGCEIRYTYDNAGNRTRREWYCWGDHEMGGGGGGRSEGAATEPVEGPLAANSLSPMPNPASDQLRVELKLPVEDGLFEITDMKGQVIATTRASGQMIEFDVSQLSAATYLVRLTAGSERLMTTVTVDHP